MISKSFQILLIVLTSINLITIIFYIRKMEMRVKYALIWIGLSIILLVLAIFPSTLMTCANFLGISSDTNALFMFAVGFLYVLSFSFSIMFSRNSKKITMLVQHICILSKEIDELKLEIKTLNIDDKVDS